MNLMIVEDDRALCDGIAMALAEPGDCFIQCHTIKEAKKQWETGQAELLILDVNLPDGNGFDFLKEVRRTSAVPVLMLTANDLEMDEVMGLSLGADDYVTKPFSLAVLRARLSVLRRRCQKQVSQIYEIGALRLDFEKFLFYQGEEELALSRNEQKLLRLFVENQGQLLPRERLIERLWDEGGEFVDENALSVTVNRLRRKLGAGEQGCDYIQTVYGQGYIWKKEP